MEGGWRGWRQFVVSKKEIESDEIISFYLAPADRGKLPHYKPGQFISIKQYVPELGYEQPRQYTLSSAPNPHHLRLSVKREIAHDAKPAGKMSNMLHAGVKVGMAIDVSPPFGDFYLAHPEENKPVVLISGGVGLTPMTSMLDTLTQQGFRRKVVFVHAARNKKVHAMRKHINEIVAHHSDYVTRSVWYEDVSGAKKGEDYDEEGRIDIDKIKSQVLLPEADYYLCGPLAFMASIEEQLVENGVRKEKIHSEVFGEAASYV